MADIDYNILKVLVTDQTAGMDFVCNNDVSLFDFAIRDEAKMIFDFVKTYKTVPTKRTLIGRYAESPQDLERIDKIWKDIEDHQYNTKEYKFDLDNMKERFKKRSVKSISSAMTEKMEQGLEPDVILKDVALRLQQASVVNEGRSHIQMSAGDYIEEFKNRYDAKKNSDGEISEIKTGYSMLDTVTGGLSPAELVVIGGETNAGKSMLLSNMAVQMWMQENTAETSPDDFKKGYSILYFSLEMPYADCFDRFLARVADIPQRSIRDAILDEDQLERKANALKFIDEYQKAGNHFNIVDVPRNVTIEEVELRYQDAILQFRPDVVVVDYMGLMHDPAKAKEQDWLKMGAIAASLHEFSRAYDCIMLTAVQLTDIKRGSKTKGDQDESQKVGVHRIGRSSHIMHHVNIGIQIETRMNERALPDMRYHVIKNRKGPLGQGNMIKNFECASLYDVPYVDHVPSGDDVSENIEDLIKKVRDANES
jgi:replicative DNA helicase